MAGIGNRTRLQAAAGWLVLAVAQVASSQVQAHSTNPERKLLVSIPDRKLAVLQNGRVLQIFSVSVGAPVSPSPTGSFRIVNRIANPTYYHPGVVIPAGRSNPIGPRWIGLSKKGYGIHGTNEPRSIGKAASHGCIRLRNADVTRLFAMVDAGDEVEIRGERDGETTQIFGGAVVAQRSAMVGADAVIGGGQ